MNRLTFAADINDVVANIEQFNSELASSNELQERLAYVRCWYVVRKQDGNWTFGPSKFIGYKGLTADSYISSSNRLDGRKTESHLKKWFQEVDEETELYDELMDALHGFLYSYGKDPSRATRINILDESRDEFFKEENSGDDFHSKVVDLIVEVALSLPASNIRSLKERIAA